MSISGVGRNTHLHDIHETNAVQHVIQEILSHAVWHHVGHVVGMSAFMTGLFGALLTCGTMGGPDAYIPKPIGAPRQGMHSLYGKMVPCLTLPNGRLLTESELNRLLADLRKIQLKRGNT